MKFLCNYSYHLNLIHHKETVKSEQDPRRLAQILTGIYFPNDINGNRVSFYDSISNESWFIVFSFLSPTDFYEKLQSLHCVSKLFNKLIIDYFTRESELKGRKGYYTAGELSSKIDYYQNQPLECMFQLPNGLQQAVIVKKFPKICDINDNDKNKNNHDEHYDQRVEFEIVKSDTGNSKRNQLVSIPLDDDGIRIIFDASDYSGTINNGQEQKQETESKTSETKPPLIANSNSNLDPDDNVTIKSQKKLIINEMMDKLTLFHVNPISHTIENVIDKKDRLFGNNNGNYKLIDVNLENMFNYYICDHSINYNNKRLATFDLFDLNLYSIAQMGYYCSKRSWVVGVIDNTTDNERELNYYLNERGQIQFIIDIRDELEGVLKDKFAFFENDSAVRRKLDRYNLSKCENNRYYVKCYAPIQELFGEYDHDINNNNNNDNNDRSISRIIAPFGTKTTDKEKMKVLDTKYGKYFRLDTYFCQLISIKNNWDKMYDFWYNSELINLNDKIVKLIVDYKYKNKWQCAFILDNANVHKSKSSDLYYYRNVDEMLKMMKKNDNVVKLQAYFGKQVGTVVYQRKAIVIYDLNQFDPNNFTYFGRYTSKKQQLKMLEIACTWFENDTAIDLWQEIQKVSTNILLIDKGYSNYNSL